MTVLHADLDNTIIYSYRHDIGMHKRTVEWYQGRELSFITEKTYELLKTVREKMLVVPTSTRTVEQYERIDLGTGPFSYALVCNGGVLLAEGKRDPEWYQDSLEDTEESREELECAIRFLEADPGRFFELRFPEELFLFTKCEEPERTVRGLRERLDLSKVQVFHNGFKVYVLPEKLSKGHAVRRFREYIGAGAVVAAGDSEFDIPMLAEADIGMAPFGFCRAFGAGLPVREAGETELFSEYVLAECIKFEEERRAG